MHKHGNDGKKKEGKCNVPREQLAVWQPVVEELVEDGLD